MLPDLLLGKGPTYYIDMCKLRIGSEGNKGGSTSSAKSSCDSTWQHPDRMLASRNPTISLQLFSSSVGSLMLCANWITLL